MWTDEGKHDNYGLLNTEHFSRVYLKMLISARHCLHIQIEKRDTTMKWWILYPLVKLLPSNDLKKIAFVLSNPGK